MKTLGIIAEYNPFHNGHLYHLKVSKKLTKADFVIVVMSGNFTQRGEPAFLDKWKRAKVAVDCGVDLVLELPFAFACNNAEYFAKGAVDILNGLGCVDYLSFGSEMGKLESLKNVAVFLSSETETFKKHLKLFLDKGVSYPKARSEAVFACIGSEASNLLSEPNNILAVEYLKQLLVSGSKIEPFTVKRKGAAYHDAILSEKIASASAIRNKWGQTLELEDIKPFLPVESQTVLNEINGHIMPKLNDFHKLIVMDILHSETAILKNIFACGEGLENRLKKAVRNTGTTEELIDAVISKRYTRTRINRILIQLLMRLDKDTFSQISNEALSYARVLGLNEKGADILRHIKNTECANIPVITNINKDVRDDMPLCKLLKYDVLASVIYNLVQNKNLYTGADYIVQPYIRHNEKTIL